MLEDNKTIKYLLFILVPVIIYWYFSPYKVGTIYGDDLYYYCDNKNISGFMQSMLTAISSQKFRPVYGAFIYVLLHICNKHLVWYFIFNVLVQSANVIILAGILNKFINSYVVSIIWALIYGLSRLMLYSLTQLAFGGVMEGLAMTFFLLSLSYVVSAFGFNQSGKTSVFRQLLLAILFSNLAIYTHERYIVMFLAIAFTAVVLPFSKLPDTKQRIAVVLIALSSILINVGIKILVLKIPFFVGTGGTNISFSIKSVMIYLVEGLLSIIQINSGPEYLVGIPHTSLTWPYQLLLIIIISGYFIVFIKFFKNNRKAKKITGNVDHTMMLQFVLLATLLLCMLPAIVTIRLEQRWLQAPFSIAVLMLTIAICNNPFKTTQVRNKIMLLFFIGIFITDHNFLVKGFDNFYFRTAERQAAYFKEAIQNNIIKKAAVQIFFLDKTPNLNDENALRWAIGDGRIFDFYQGASKKLYYIDSTGNSLDPTAVAAFQHFNADSSQIIGFIDSKIIDIDFDIFKKR